MELIEKGEPCKAWFTYGENVIARMHPECFEAMQKADLYDEELPPAGTYRRGCWCGEREEHCICGADWTPRDVIELRKEVERLRKLVRSAYTEGYVDGQSATWSYENDSHDGTTLERDWDGSESKIELGDVCRVEEECK